MEKHYISLLNDYYGVLLTKKQEEMLKLFYNEDFSLAEIAEDFKVSRQAVRDAIKRGEGALVEFENKLGMARLYQSLSVNLKQLIEKIENNDGVSAVETAKSMLALLDE